MSEPRPRPVIPSRARRHEQRRQARSTRLERARTGAALGLLAGAFALMALVVGQPVASAFEDFDPGNGGAGPGVLLGGSDGPSAMAEAAASVAAVRPGGPPGDELEEQAGKLAAALRQGGGTTGVPGETDPAPVADQDPARVADEDGSGAEQKTAAAVGDTWYPWRPEGSAEPVASSASGDTGTGGGWQDQDVEGGGDDGDRDGDEEDGRAHQAALDVMLTAAGANKARPGTAAEMATGRAIQGVIGPIAPPTYAPIAAEFRPLFDGDPLPGATAPAVPDPTWNSTAIVFYPADTPLAGDAEAEAEAAERERDVGAAMDWLQGSVGQDLLGATTITVDGVLMVQGKRPLAEYLVPDDDPHNGGWADAEAGLVVDAALLTTELRDAGYLDTLDVSQGDSVLVFFVGNEDNNFGCYPEATACQGLAILSERTLDGLSPATAEHDPAEFEHSRRVVKHEFGHSQGLLHPDEYGVVVGPEMVMDMWATGANFTRFERVLILAQRAGLVRRDSLVSKDLAIVIGLETETPAWAGDPDDPRVTGYGDELERRDPADPLTPE